MVNKLSSNIFYPCVLQDCLYPVYKKGRPSVVPSWYEGGPPITYLHLPVADENKPWGNILCDTCECFFAGHYSHKLIDTTDKSALAMYIPPTSRVLKEFTSLKVYPPPQEYTIDLAKITINRKRGGGQKAVTTRTTAKKSTTATTQLL